MALSIGRNRTSCTDCILAVGLDHDALTGALLSRFDHVFDEGVGDSGEALRPIWRLLAVEHHSGAEVLCLFLDNPETIVPTDKTSGEISSQIPSPVQRS